MAAPTSSSLVLLLAVVSLAGWGLWANTYRRNTKWRFELYAFDFAFGAAFCALIAAVTIGTYASEITVMDNFTIIRRLQIGFGLLAGGVFCLGNLLLLGGISLAGMAFAFPVAIAMAFAVTSFWMRDPAAAPGTAWLSHAVVAGGIALACYAFSLFQSSKRPAGGGKAAQAVPSALKGILVTLCAGPLLGGFLPLANRAMRDQIDMAPCALAFTVAMGLLSSTFLCNVYLMNLPLQGEPLRIRHYTRGSARQHFSGAMGGALWCAGTLAYFGVLSGPPEAKPMQAAAWVAGPGIALLGGFSGLQVWKDFADGPARARILLILAVLLLVAGSALLAMSGWRTFPANS